MQIDVALLPGQRFDAAASVCVIVDVLRASSSIVTLLERGAGSVIAASDIEAARALSEKLPGYVLCGEKDGLPPEGFAYGNSPSEFSR
jgi:2-phosphosulfolactate phosphatase